MIQLAFQPAYDPYHTVFRFFRIRHKIRVPIQLEHYRIVDFYVCFPSRLVDVRLSPSHGRLKRSVQKAARTSYSEQPSDELVFGRMSPVQDATLHTLASEGFLDGGEFTRRHVFATAKEISGELVSRVERANESERDLIELAGLLLNDYPISGSNGLKARTGLMDYRYDAV